MFFYDVYWNLEPRVDLTKPEKCEEAEVGGGVHGGDLVRDALLLSVVHLAIIAIVVSITRHKEALDIQHRAIEFMKVVTRNDCHMITDSTLAVELLDVDS